MPDENGNFLPEELATPPSCPPLVDTPPETPEAEAAREKAGLPPPPKIKLPDYEAQKRDMKRDREVSESQQREARDASQQARPQPATPALTPRAPRG